jgi:hypothetical protein
VDHYPPRRVASVGDRPIRSALLRLILGAVLVGLLIVGGTGFRVWQVARVDDRAKADVVIVLGAAQYDGTPSAVLGSRLDHAARLWRDGVAPVIVTVGGRRDGDNYTEAQAGRKYLTSYGIPPGAVVPIDEGRDTFESLRAVAGRAALAHRGDRQRSLALMAVSYDVRRPRIDCLDLADPKWSDCGDPHHPGPLHRPGERRAAGLPVDARPGRVLRH